MRRMVIAAAVSVLILGVTLQAQQLAFPGAEGCGAYSAGGRGGDVYHVTTLADYNDYKAAHETPIPGTLRYGLRTATGPRTIVFDVSGYIELKARLEFGNHYITIAGQTAPGDGITLRHWDTRLYQADNVIVRFLRVRPGYYADAAAFDVYSSTHGTDPNHLNGGLDAMSCEFTTNTIIDHCSFSWGADELASITSDSNDITYQWDFITEPLNWNSHAYCSLLRPGKTGRLTHHHNLYSDCVQRLTRFGNYNDGVTTRFDWVNNVAYNFGGNNSNYVTYNQDSSSVWYYDEREGSGPTGGTDGELINVNYIKNYFIVGPSTKTAALIMFYGAVSSPYGKSTDSKMWVDNNYWDGNKNGVIDGTADTTRSKMTGTYVPMTSAFPLNANAPLTIDDAPTALNRVLTYGGNWIARDAVDTRVINQVLTGTGAIINYPSDVGGYPTLNSVSRPAGFDTDGDGMPDAWEIARGLDPNDPNDRNIVRNDGYTNLEQYLNYLTFRPIVSTIPGDLNNDGKVDFNDLALFLEDWQVCDPNYVPLGDLNGDNCVDFRDFAIFAQNWTN